MIFLQIHYSVWDVNALEINIQGFSKYSSVQKTQSHFLTQICDISKNTFTLNKSIFHCIAKLSCYKGPKDVFINFFMVLIRGARKSWNDVSFLIKTFHESLNSLEKVFGSVDFHKHLNWNLPKKRGSWPFSSEFFQDHITTNLHDT